MSSPITPSPQWHQVVASRGRSSIPSSRSTTRSRSRSPQPERSPSHSMETSLPNSPDNETETSSLASYRSRSPSPPRLRYYKQVFSDTTALTVQLLVEEEMRAEDYPRSVLDVAEEVFGALEDEMMEEVMVGGGGGEGVPKVVEILRLVGVVKEVLRDGL